MDNPQRGEHTIKDRDGVEWKLALRNNEICTIEGLLGIRDFEEALYGNDEKGLKALNNTGWRAVLFATTQRYHKKTIVTLEDAGDLGDKLYSPDIHIAVHCMLRGLTRAEYDAKIAEMKAKKAEGEAATSPPEQAAAEASAS